MPGGRVRATSGHCRHSARASSVGEVVHASDVLDDAVAYVVPDVHAEGEVRLGFHGQAPLDLSWPAGIYTPCSCVA